MRRIVVATSEAADVELRNLRIRCREPDHDGVDDRYIEGCQRNCRDVKPDAEQQASSGQALENDYRGLSPGEQNGAKKRYVDRVLF